MPCSEHELLKDLTCMDMQVWGLEIRIPTSGSASSACISCGLETLRLLLRKAGVVGTYLGGTGADITRQLHGDPQPSSAVRHKVIDRSM